MSIDEYLASELRCFNADVNKAKTIIITHCPIAKKNNNARENNILSDIVATAIILAKIGEEQGLAAKAKKVPTKNGKKNKLPDLF